MLLTILSVLTALDFVFEWRYGVEYQGIHYTELMYTINIAWLVAVWLVFLRTRQRPSFAGNLLSHFVLFVWLAWYAFPYLGELPL